MPELIGAPPGRDGDARLFPASADGAPPPCPIPSSSLIPPLPLSSREALRAWIVYDSRGRQLLSETCDLKVRDRIKGQERSAMVYFLRWAGFKLEGLPRGGFEITGMEGEGGEEEKRGG